MLISLVCLLYLFNPVVLLMLYTTTSRLLLRMKCGLIPLMNLFL